MFHRKKKRGQKQLKQEIGVNKRSPMQMFHYLPQTDRKLFQKGPAQQVFS